MNTNQIGDFRTAGKRVRVETLWNGKWKGKDLQGMIQVMADEGFDLLGKIDEFIPTGVCAAHTEDFLFVRAYSTEGKTTSADPGIWLEGEE